MNICIVEKNNNSNNLVTQEELDELLTKELKNNYDFDENEFMANCLFFNENYTHRQLTKIADYYKIKKTRKKELLVNDIVLFEMNQENKERVLQRKLFDYYLECLSEDDYYKKFVIRH